MTDVETRGTWAAIGEAMRDIRAAEAVLREEQDDAWRRYLARVDAILAFDLQADEASEDDDHDASHLLDTLRTRIDELKVQSRLGAMEGEDLVGRLRAAVRRLGTVR